MPSQYESRPHPINLGSLGHIEGLTLSAQGSKPACHYFGGLPYALPPVGPYRFRRARPLPQYHKYGTKANPGRYNGRTAMCPQPGFGKEPDKTFWDEDCLHLNIWVPAGKAPEGAWPVFFYIHGGWLQYGTANTPPAVGAALIGETALKCIIVMPSYRLNVFGFLASRELQAEAERNGETVGNMGFWDQRMALEWTARNIGAFGGDTARITVGGYSAGSHSAFQQLAHDLDLPDSESLIKRAVMWSNGPGVQAKFLPEVQSQFDELLAALHIPLSLSASEKLARLRNASPDQIVAVQDTLKQSEFRALSDGAFMSKTLIESINDGSFARKLKRRGVKILNGECRDEHAMYGQWRKPKNTYESLYQRLVADYPERAVKPLMPHYFPGQKLPSWCKDWPDAFGRIYADMQVHCMERGFADKLAAGGLTVGKDLLRYRINWRAKCVDTFLPLEWKTTHSSDMAIWLWGNGWGEGLTAEEKKIVEPFNAMFASFVKYEDVQWPVKGPRSMLRLNSEGITDFWEDDNWDKGLAVWKVVNEGPSTSKAKL